MEIELEKASKSMRSCGQSRNGSSWVRYLSEKGVSCDHVGVDVDVCAKGGTQADKALDHNTRVFTTPFLPDPTGKWGWRCPCSVLNMSRSYIREFSLSAIGMADQGNTEKHDACSKSRP